MNSTETPGGPGIPAGWYDDPSGQGLRWWDGVQWTEHVHTAESAAAATSDAVEGEREAPPPQLVKLRESIQARGAKGVGIVLGGLVLIIVVVALLLSGGSGEGSKAAQPGGATPATGQNAALQQEIKVVRQQLKSANLPPAEKKSLQKQLTRLEKQAGGAKDGKSAKGGKAAKSGKSSSSSKSNKSAKSGGQSAKQKKKTPGEEGN